LDAARPTVLGPTLSMRRADSDRRARSCVIAIAPKKVPLKKEVSTYRRGRGWGDAPGGLVSLWAGLAKTRHCSFLSPPSTHYMDADTVTPDVGRCGRIPSHS